MYPYHQGELFKTAPAISSNAENGKGPRQLPCSNAAGAPSPAPMPAGATLLCCLGKRQGLLSQVLKMAGPAILLSYSWDAFTCNPCNQGRIYSAAQVRCRAHSPNCCSSMRHSQLFHAQAHGGGSPASPPPGSALLSCSGQVQGLLSRLLSIFIFHYTSPFLSTKI